MGEARRRREARDATLVRFGQIFDTFTDEQHATAHELASLLVDDCRGKPTKFSDLVAGKVLAMLMHEEYTAQRMKDPDPAEPVVARDCAMTTLNFIMYLAQLQFNAAVRKLGE